MRVRNWPARRRVQFPSLRLSTTERSENSSRPSGRWAIPPATTSHGDDPPMDSPSKEIEPAVGDSNPEMVRSVVVLPAPLAPTSATISPALTRSETERSAWIGP